MIAWEDVLAQRIALRRRSAWGDHGVSAANTATSGQHGAALNSPAVVDLLAGTSSRLPAAPMCLFLGTNDRLDAPADPVSPG